jgi:hypothetical protein
VTGIEVRARICVAVIVFDITIPAAGKEVCMGSLLCDLKVVPATGLEPVSG